MAADSTLFPFRPRGEPSRIWAANFYGRRRIQRMQTKVVRIITVLFLLAGLVVLSVSLMAQGGGAGQGRGGGGGRGPQAPPLLMTSMAWEDGGVIPDKYTQKAGAMAVSPALSWSQVPMGTQSFVLLLHDPEPVLQKGSKM